MNISKKFVLIVAFALVSSGLIQAETNVWITLSTVVVTGTRISQTFSQVTRNVSVIDEKEINNSPANSVPELLEHVLSSDIQERSPYGVQADVTMRGSTFQQTLILIDGVRVNDSQTAHHNMDLPVTLNDIEKIEVLQGHSSSVYGPDAFGGVVNIVTKKTKNKELFSQVKLAEYNTQLVSVSYGNKWNNYSQKVSLEKKKSDGFRYDTDFDNFNFYSDSNWDIAKGEINLSLGFMDKEFGAYDFYTPGRNYPSKEWTKTYFSKLGVVYKIGKISLQPKIFYRQHNDKYMLDITRPTWYVNEHLTYFYGGEIQANIPLRNKVELTIGGEVTQDQIESERLGNHIQPRQALFSEYHTSIFSNLDLDAGLRIDNSNWGQQISPTLGIGYWISPLWKLRSSVGRAFRSPSFTELYYKDPANEGNSELKPEEAISYEAGADFIQGKHFNASITLFDRKQTNLIDWVGTTETGPWKAENIGEVRIFGIDSEVKFNLYSFETRFNYSWMGSKKTQDYYSKYALQYPTNQFSLEVSRPLNWNIIPVVKLIYKERLSETGYFLMNSRISKSIDNMEIFIEGTNLLDIKYEEIKGVPQPGRWLGAGVTYKL
ncbi:MAG: TonB-dependent receptor [Elusimicrobiota bacterium]